MPRIGRGICSFVLWQPSILGGFSDRKFGDPGAVPLWEEGLSGGDSGYFGMVLTATRRGDACELFVLPGFRDGQDDPSNAYLRSRYK